MKKLKISSIKDIETLLKVFYQYIPRAPKSIHTIMVTIFPYLTLISGTLLISISCLPYFFPSYPLDPLTQSNLIQVNIHLTRLLFAVMGMVLIVSFNRVIRRDLVGWYNVFFVTLFHTFYVLVVFNLGSLLLLLVTWAYLFEIQSDFTDRV
jgi:hypothetical protein